MEFMEENPGAGNVLLRTLASILAQRLRQLNPKAFGLSAYAVVDSPELAKAAPPPVTEPSEEEEVPTTTFPNPEPVAVKPENLPVEPPLEVPPGDTKIKLSTKTQAVPDPDDLEPL
jgi:hypothetical protein